MVYGHGFRRTVTVAGLGLTIGLAGLVTMASAACLVADPSGTPLNVRIRPLGVIVQTLTNGTPVIRGAQERYEGKRWTQIRLSSGGAPIGWVFDDYLDCRNETDAAVPTTPPVKVSPTPVPVTPPVVSPPVVASPVPAPARPTTGEDAATRSPLPDDPAIAERARRRQAASLLLPGLMATAGLYDFRLIELADVRESLRKADLAFKLEDIVGVVYTTDYPTAQAAANEILTYDALACGGDYVSATDPSAEGRVDVAHSFSRCVEAGKERISRYMTLSRKSGGYFIVCLTAATDEIRPDGFRQMDASLFDAALKLSGKF